MIGRKTLDNDVTPTWKRNAPHAMKDFRLTLKRKPARRKITFHVRYETVIMRGTARLWLAFGEFSEAFASDCFLFLFAVFVHKKFFSWADQPNFSTCFLTKEFFDNCTKCRLFIVCFFKNLKFLPSKKIAPFGCDFWVKNTVLYNILAVLLYFSPPQAKFFSVFARKLHFFNEI